MNPDGKKSDVIRLCPGVVLHQSPYLSQPQPTASTGKQLHLRQNNNSAFGDGSHATTRLCAGALNYLCKKSLPAKVLDVGTGSGILARIALAHGAGFVVATDIDPVALGAARENARQDIHRGEYVVCNRAPDSWGPVFQLVVANILQKTLRQLAPSLVGALAADGHLLISGFTTGEMPVLKATFNGLGLTLVNQASLDGWMVLFFRQS